VTSSATAIATTSATVRGTVNPHGCATSYTFQYGTSTSYGHSTTARSAGAGTRSVAASSAITGLIPGTVYHFRIEASNGAGTTFGADATFTTQSACVKGAKPVVATEAPAGISPTGATLHGTVNPRGCPTSYRFEYGTTTGYGRTTSVVSAGTGTTTIREAAAIAGLAPSTVYHFRIVATDAAGTTVGQDKAFGTTPLPPSSIAIVGHRTPVERGYVALVKLRCFAGGHSCSGPVRIFRNHRRIGTGAFTLAPHSTATVAVKLNGRGRRLMRLHRSLRAEVVARSSAKRTGRFTRLVRTFSIP
jgi:hypothetical protein